MLPQNILNFKRYPDGCYAVVRSNRRGPCGNSQRTALERFLKSGFIAYRNTAK